MRRVLLRQHVCIPQGKGVTMNSKSCVTATVAALLLCAACGALAQVYPSKPITFLCGQPAGSGPDIMARVFADSMSETLGQRVLVVNRGGAGGSWPRKRLSRRRRRLHRHPGAERHAHDSVGDAAAAIRCHQGLRIHLDALRGPAGDADFDEEPRPRAGRVPRERTKQARRRQLRITRDRLVRKPHGRLAVAEHR
jgi:hypothetical protein